MRSPFVDHNNTDIENGIHNNKVNFNFSKIIAKDLNHMRYTEAVSTHSIGELHNADQLGNKFNHLASRSDKLELSDPATEDWYRTIKEMNSNRSTGLTDSEVNEKTRLSADLTTMVTTVVPINNSSHKC